MPASQKTPNYQLPVYAEDDITSYLQDYNPAMRKIDTQMKANADAAANAQSDVDSLETRVQALEDAPAGVTELDADTDVTGFDNGYILVNNNGKLGAIAPNSGTTTDPNAIHASGGGTFSASEGIGSTGPYNIVVDEEPAGVPITSDDVTIPESATAFGGQTVTEALESLSEIDVSAKDVSYDTSDSLISSTSVNTVKKALDTLSPIYKLAESLYIGFLQSAVGHTCAPAMFGDANIGNVGQYAGFASQPMYIKQYTDEPEETVNSANIFLSKKLKPVSPNTKIICKFLQVSDDAELGSFEIPAGVDGTVVPTTAANLPVAKWFYCYVTGDQSV